VLVQYFGFPVFYYVFWATINEVIAMAGWILVIAVWIIAVELNTKNKVKN
jgi:hypothetical protein